MHKRLLTFGLAATLLVGCGETNSPESEFEKVVVDSKAKTKDALPTEQIVDLLNSVPPPLELAMLIKKVGGEYSVAPLNNTDNADNYNSSHKRAINLGVYGADLGYANIYDQTEDAFSYLNVVKDLADNLNVGQFFDFETIKKLASAGGNMDELLRLSTQNFAKMNDYLKEKEKVNLSVQMMAGGWIEGLHIACYVAENHNSKELNERIGEQKEALSQIMMLLEMFKNDDNIKQLYEDMKPLEVVFEKVEINTIEGESRTEMIDGIPTLVSDTRTEINVSEEVFNEIKSTTEKIRAKLIK